MPQFESNLVRVSNGDITVENPQSLAPTSKDIIINSAEIRWQGVSTTSSSDDFQDRADARFRNVANFNNGFSEAFSLNFPSVPSGFSFFNHRIEGQIRDALSTTGENFNFSINGNQVQDSSNTVFFSDTNQVGADVTIIISADSVTGSSLELEARVETTGVRTITNTKKTKNPRVTRDVSADTGSLTLNDGELSSYIPLSGLDPNTEEFFHDIDGSGEAKFQFRFDFERAFPDAVKELRIFDADAGEIRRVALADPSDPQLVHNSVRVYSATANQILSIDVVDPSDPDAVSSHRIYHPVDGILSPRAFGTV